MKPETTKEKPAASKWTVIKKKLRKYMYILGFLMILLLGFIIFLKYFYTYSDGSRTGLLQKFSRKGLIFKTYEGELILSSVISSNNVPLASEKFYFSVINKEIAPQLDSLQGRTVSIFYKQKKAPLFWKGDTPFYVDSVRLR